MEQDILFTIPEEKSPARVWYHFGQFAEGWPLISKRQQDL